MAEFHSDGAFQISRDRLAELLNEDLSREYQAIISYVVYSQVLSGAEYMGIAAQLELHAKQELDHALSSRGRSTIWARCPQSPPSRCGLQKIQSTCSASILRMKTRPYATTAIACDNAKR